jgi:phosphoglycerate dehydrogenase-like enzyme
MPAGVPVGTLAIGEPGATNAGLLAAKILATSDPALAERVKAFRTAQTEAVAERPGRCVIPPGETIGILGGGQLGRMMAFAAARLGYRCILCARGRRYRR